jgi:hypothetical protein
MFAPETERQSTHVETIGGVDRQQDLVGAYLVQEMDAPETTKDQLLYSYTGQAAASTEAQMSQEAARSFRTNEEREKLEQGRAPVPQGRKQAQGSEDIHLTCARNTLHMDSLAHSNVQLRPQLASVECIGESERGVDVDVREHMNDRLEPDLLDAFRDNPYTQSLSSAV